MFITSKYSGYNRHGEQVAAGLFLILMQPKSYYTVTCNCGHVYRADGLYSNCPNCGSTGFSPADTYKQGLQTERKTEYHNGANDPIRAIVRYSTFKQLGNFMMGFARVHGTRLTLSGAYGGDGLICNVPSQVYENYGIELPAELYEAWKNGGGWNSAGSEAPAMRKWALENLDALRK